MDGELHVTLANDLDEVGRLAALTEEFLDSHTQDVSLAFKVNVAMDEVLTNIISYGLEDQPAATVDVRMQVFADTLTIVVTDPGPAFDPLAEAPEPDLESDIDDRPIGGLGVFLVQQFMDHCAYARVEDHNRLTLTKTINADDI
jgi:anti-sigma regulatory factor (Ser/Thr protein kinase)